MIIEEEIADAISNGIQECIDFEIVSNMLCSKGWTRATISLDSYMSYDVEGWVNEHCKGKFKHFDLEYVFEDSRDATWFKMRWSQ